MYAIAWLEIGVAFIVFSKCDLDQICATFFKCFFMVFIERSINLGSNFSFEPKTNDFFCISALVSEMSQLKKIMTLSC